MVVYRLITCGTMEEKIYRKQVFKQGLSMVSNGDEEVFRYFTKGDLRELFSANYGGFAASETQRELQVGPISVPSRFRDRDPLV